MPEKTFHPVGGSLFGRAPTTETPVDIYADETAHAAYTAMWVWDSDSLIWVKQPLVSDNQIWGYNGTNWHEVRLDTSTRSAQTISYVHHELHGGKVYRAYRGDTLATNDTIIIAVTTPAGAEEQHTFWSLYSAGAITFDILRNVTSYTGGTAFTPVNNNFRSSNTSNCTVEVGSNGALADGIAITGGSEADKFSFGSGNKSGGTAGHEDEFILEESEINTYRITAVGNNIVCDLHLTWYEHTPKAT